MGKNITYVHVLYINQHIHT